MADLKPLIRVRKHTVEQKQKALAELYRQAEEMAAQKYALKEEMESEQRAAGKDNSAEMLQYLGTYVEAVKKKIKRLDAQMVDLDRRIELAREDMREAFAEFKKIEITQERREAEALAEIERKQAQLLDDMAIDGFRRAMGEAV